LLLIAIKYIFPVEDVRQRKIKIKRKNWRRSRGAGRWRKKIVRGELKF
jgi:hypothetical protein